MSETAFTQEKRSTTEWFRLYPNDSIEKICRDNDFTFKKKIKKGGGDDDNGAGTLGAAGLSESIAS